MHETETKITLQSKKMKTKNKSKSKVARTVSQRVLLYNVTDPLSPSDAVSRKMLIVETQLRVNSKRMLN